MANKLTLAYIMTLSVVFAFTLFTPFITPYNRALYLQLADAIHEGTAHEFSPLPTQSQNPSLNQPLAPMSTPEPKGNITQTIANQFPSSALDGIVLVDYESPTMIVMEGDAITVGRMFNTNLWKAVDLLRNDYGYNLDKVVVNGLGTSANPDRFYIVMTK